MNVSGPLPPGYKRKGEGGKGEGPDCRIRGQKKEAHTSMTMKMYSSVWMI